MNLADMLDCSIKTVHNVKTGCSFFPDHTEWHGIYPEKIWRFDLNQKAPLIIELENNVRLMPNYYFTTNLGSVPILLRLFFPQDEFPIEYALHDDEYNRHGVFASVAPGKPFVFVRTTREGADVRLYQNTIAISGASPKRARKVFLAVRMGGYFPWRLGRTRERKLKGVSLC